jgi:ketosteroid isomerase-like protein
MNNIEQLISTLFVATDQGEWETVEKCFATKVKLDYSSMSGNPAVEVTPQQITDSWKGILPGFDFTHHQIGNFITEEKANTTKVFCYGTATHVINAAEEKIWTVVGSYDFQLIKEGKDWKISAMTFNFKYQAGNTSLPQIAINRVKNGTTEVPPTTAEKNKATVKAFFKALENEKVDELVDLFDDQATHINPYHSDIFPKGAKGKEGIRAYWTPVFPNFDGMEFPIEEIYAMEDPNIVFVKYSGIIQLKDSAGQYKNNYYSTFKFNEEGKIVEYVEIFNPITAARGFGLLDQIK